MMNIDIGKNNREYFPFGYDHNFFIKNFTQHTLEIKPYLPHKNYILVHSAKEKYPEDATEIKFWGDSPSIYYLAADKTEFGTWDLAIHVALNITIAYYKALIELRYFSYIQASDRVLSWWLKDGMNVVGGRLRCFKIIYNILYKEFYPREAYNTIYRHDVREIMKYEIESIHKKYPDPYVLDEYINKVFDNNKSDFIPLWMLAKMIKGEYNG